VATQVAQIAGRAHYHQGFKLVLPDSLYFQRVSAKRRNIRCLHDVQGRELSCLSSLRLLT
jgi:hypothetical protein